MKKGKIIWDSQPLGKMNDYALAKILGVQQSTVRRQRVKRSIKPFFIPRNWDNQPLGEMPDTWIAQKLKVNVAEVRGARTRRGIGRYYPTEYIDWNSQPLGKMSDTALAKSLGLEREVVKSARRARNIKPFRENIKEICPVCLKTFEYIRERRHRKYCSKICSDTASKVFYEFRNRFQMEDLPNGVLAMIWARLRTAERLSYEQ